MCWAAPHEKWKNSTWVLKATEKNCFISLFFFLSLSFWDVHAWLFLVSNPVMCFCGWNFNKSWTVEFTPPRRCLSPPPPTMLCSQFFFSHKIWNLISMFQCNSPKHTERRKCTLNANPIHMHLLTWGGNRWLEHWTRTVETTRVEPDHQQPLPFGTDSESVAVGQQAERAATTWSLSLTNWDSRDTNTEPDWATCCSVVASSGSSNSSSSSSSWPEGAKIYTKEVQNNIDGWVCVQQSRRSLTWMLVPGADTLAGQSTISDNQHLCWIQRNF